jgi:uncharacterized membrane protein YdfJ with MMPL/SSD domain
MRMAFAIIGLLVALAVVAVLARKQLGATRVAVPPAPAGAPANVREQSEQIQQQIKQQLDAAMQQRRPMPEDSQ